ncbi:MAG TPA: right-handed parallel beta-helix repeat-containing protein [Anaerolineales bacterium]|nr:right-handed parallel beta-helix repeat-containing protein [Anaerolineales bacterium]
MKRTHTIFLLSTLAAWILAQAFFSTPARAGGQTFHVDPSGSDASGDGSPDSPWATILYAANQVTAGDTVLIHPGAYEGGVIVEASGSAAEPITFQADGPGVIIEGSGGEQDAFYITEAGYVIVDGLTIQHADRAGLRISLSDHVTVRNCTFADNGTWGLFTDFSDYTLVENVESYGAVEEHGIYISNSSDFPTIRNNRLHHNYANGLHMNGDISMGGDGVISDGLIENNIIYENGLAGGSGINMDGVTDTLVRNNLLYDNHSSGISVYQIDGGSGSQNNRILNNTILMPDDGRWAVNIPDGSDTGNQVYNNILYSDHTWRGSIAIAEPGLAGFESDYNIIVDRFSTDSGDSNMDFAAWQALGYDLNSILATPEELFVDEAAGDYRLKPGSPAIDAGVALPDVPADLEGNPRPIGLAYDIGAYEFVPALAMSAFPSDQAVHLAWGVNITLPITATWRIDYNGPAGDEPPPISGIGPEVRTYSLTGLENYTIYTFLLNAVVGAAPVLTATATAMPTDLFAFLPVIFR